MVRRSPPAAARCGARVAWRAASYPRAPRGLRLGPDDVHLWCATVRVPSSVERHLGGSLDDDERASAARLIATHDRTRYVASHGLLRYVLGIYLDTPPERVRYRYAPRGKPSLARAAGAPPIRFNLSHSGDLALVAVTLRRPVGVDLERVQPGRDLLGIARRYFSPREAAVLAALAPGDQVEAFYNGWTRKEAYIKARGDGLALPLDSFDVSLAPEVPAALLRSARGDQEVRRWDLVGFVPAPGYVAALVVGAGIRRIAGWRLEVPAQFSAAGA